MPKFLEKPAIKDKSDSNCLKYTKKALVMNSLKKPIIWDSYVCLALITQAPHGLAPKCKLINIHELINKSTNDYVTLLPCKNHANVNNKG